MGLFDIFSNKNAQDAANARIAGINQGYTDATGAVQTGLNNANQYYGSAYNAWAPLAGQGAAGANAYADALGLNGPEGNARAQVAFQNNPGYQFQLQSGLGAIDRAAAARGRVQSGNTLAAEQQYGSNLANQGWSNYLAAFNPLLSQQTAAAQGQSGVLTNQAGTNYNSGLQLGNLGWQKGTGIGDAQAAADLAKNQASANLWGVLLGGASLGANMLGFTNGGLGRSLGSLGGNSLATAMNQGVNPYAWSSLGINRYSPQGLQ